MISGWDGTWDDRLDLMVMQVTGPYDESDEVNHDPDSLVGEEDESGFDEMADWEEWQTYEDDGFDDAGDDDEEAEDGDDEESEEG